MSESIGEMIVPGTYIEVRAEGLIGVGGIPTGNIGIVGTANRGPVGEAVLLGSYAEALAVFGSYDAWPADPATPRLTLVRALEQVFRGGGSTVYGVRIAALPAQTTMRSMTWRVRAGNNSVLFSLVATSPGTWANDIVVGLTAPAEEGGDSVLTLTLGPIRETFRAAGAAALAREVNQGSSLVTATAPAQNVAESVPTSVIPIEEANRGGPDGTAVTGTHVATGLAALANAPINLVTVAGLGADAVAAEVLGHLEATENDGKERIAILGTRGDSLASIALDSAAVSNRRAVLAAPGILGRDAAADGREVALTPAYTAALVTGKLASLAPHISATNKDVAVGGLTRLYTRAEQKQLLGNRILALFQNIGIRILKGITTDDGPFKQISVRRIVDYAKAGVRIGANPYIGRLNNARVRAAMKATLDGFLSQMVLDEMLVSYELEVSATRSQEINGIAAVTLVLRPTFSIDFVRVTMILE